MKNEDKLPSDFRLENAKIEDIGLYYCGHGNITYVNIILGGRGGGELQSRCLKTRLGNS